MIEIVEGVFDYFYLVWYFGCCQMFGIGQIFVVEQVVGVDVDLCWCQFFQVVMLFWDCDLCVCIVKICLLVELVGVFVLQLVVWVGGGD